MLISDALMVLRSLYRSSMDSCEIESSDEDSRVVYRVKVHFVIGPFGTITIKAGGHDLPEIIGRVQHLAATRVSGEKLPEPFTNEEIGAIARAYNRTCTQFGNKHNHALALASVLRKLGVIK